MAIRAERKGKKKKTPATVVWGDEKASFYLKRKEAPQKTGFWRWKSRHGFPSKKEKKGIRGIRREKKPSTASARCFERKEAQGADSPGNSDFKKKEKKVGSPEKKEERGNASAAPTKGVRSNCASLFPENEGGGGSGAKKKARRNPRKKRREKRGNLKDAILSEKGNGTCRG